MSRKTKFPGFKKCMEMMRQRDPQVQEDGFHTLRPRVAEFLHELIEAFENEESDLRYWLLELTGEARSPEAFSVLAEHLQNKDDEDLRFWAAHGLGMLGTKEARRLLWEARSYTFDDEEETKRFRELIDDVREKY
jgi:HEAT repeat protein